MATAKSIIASVIAVVLGTYMISALAPQAITTLFNVNTTGWGADSITLFNVLPIMVILTLVVIIVSVVLDNLSG